MTDFPAFVEFTKRTPVAEFSRTEADAKLAELKALYELRLRQVNELIELGGGR